MNDLNNLITIDGEEVEVREDTARAFHFVHWDVVTGAIALAILIVAFITLCWWAARSGMIGNPAAVEKTDYR